MMVALPMEIYARSLMEPELSDLFFRLAPISCGSRVRKKPPQIHWSAYVFCEPSSNKISAQRFEKNRSAQLEEIIETQNFILEDLLEAGLAPAT